MAQGVSDLGECGAGHGEVAGEGVAEVVEAEVLQAGDLDGAVEGVADARRAVALPRGEDQVGVEAAQAVGLADGVEGEAFEGDGTGLAVLGVAEGDGRLARAEVHVAPAQAEDLGVAAAGAEGDGDGAVEVAARALPARGEEADPLLLVEEAGAASGFGEALDAADWVRVHPLQLADGTSADLAEALNDLDTESLRTPPSAVDPGRPPCPQLPIETSRLSTA